MSSVLPLAPTPGVLLTVGAIAVIALVLAQYVAAPRAPKGTRPLPGPRGLPWFGSLRDMPATQPWKQFDAWTKEYGRIYQVQLGRQRVVVLGDSETAYELLERRSARNSSRPRLVVASEIVSRGLRLTFMPNHDLWKRERKLLNKLTSPTAAATYEPMQDLESIQMLRDMLARPQAFWGHAQRYAGSLIMQVAFNKRAKYFSSPDVTEMRAVLEDLTRAAVPGAYLVDSIPLLNYLPSFLAPWKAEGAAMYETQRRLFTRHFADVKKAMAEGKDAHCFTRFALESRKEHGLTDEEIAFLGGVAYGAGSDTTSDGINSWIMSMVKHADVVKKAQEELDRVVGRDRLPTFEDKRDLVYVQAIVQEIQRWKPIIAGGLAHMTTEDDVFDGYHIPKGSTIIPNSYSIHRDARIYPEPELFKPERFIRDGELVGVPRAERGHFGFGWGRRVCPGLYIAERSLYIVIARMLWAFDFAHAKDASGREIPIGLHRGL